ncbi:MAG: isoprenylcysteine carboxylmethyltransferase family protein [Pyrinomonadaceae bacterium]|nr:isoprenylcysteine carboxylmethyltransferase family protein [Pyrinomonadaceae bacterium]
MEQISNYVNIASFSILMICWITFAVRFLLWKKPKSAPDAKRSEVSIVGLVLQGLGYLPVWIVRRQMFSPIIPDQFLVNIIFQILAIGLSIFSVWMAVSAITELGKQWSLTARLTENHQLITSGVYGIVRHPIYTAMLGMLVATGFVLSHWLAIVLAIIIFFIGTKIRTNSEEKLLREAFADEYQKYAAKVAPLIPFVKI